MDKSRRKFFASLTGLGALAVSVPVEAKDTDKFLSINDKGQMIIENDAGILLKAKDTRIEILANTKQSDPLLDAPALKIGIEAS